MQAVLLQRRPCRLAPRPRNLSSMVKIPLIGIIARKRRVNVGHREATPSIKGTLGELARSAARRPADTCRQLCLFATTGVQDPEATFLEGWYCRQRSSFLGSRRSIGPIPGRKQVGNDRLPRAAAVPMKDHESLTCNALWVGPRAITGQFKVMMSWHAICADGCSSIPKADSQAVHLSMPWNRVPSISCLSQAQCAPRS